jgi:ubiquinone/menaquinone biosynthesis C-methylase UbiE
MLRQGKKEIMANRGGRGTALVCGSAMAMPFAEGAFQTAICGLGTHHMNVPLMLGEAKRVLTSGGRLIIADVCATPFWRSILGKIILKILLLQYGLIHHSARSQAELEAFKNVRSVAEWMRLLQESGFMNISVQELKPRLPWYPGGFALTSELAAT